MLKVLRAIVQLFAVGVLPPAAAALVYALGRSWLGAGPLGASLLAAAHLAAFVGLGAFEFFIYRRELRSVTPKPAAAAAAFVARLGAAFLGTAAAASASLRAAGPWGPWGAPVAALSGALAYALLSWLLLTQHQEMIRGRKFRAFREVFFHARVENLWARGEILFGNVRLPWGAAVKHMLVLGVTGSGKTMVFQLLMQSTIRGRVGRGMDQRGILYDNKTELVPLLHALGVPMKIAHPFDRRGVAVDFRSMVPTHTHALEIAAILMPQAKDASPDPFWVDAPRNLLASVLTSLRIGVRKDGAENPAPIDWDFRDVVLAMSSPERIREIIERNPETKGGADGYFDDARLAANILATIKTAMMYYRPIAACWHRAAEKIDLTEAVWGREEYILVLGNDEEARTAVNALNRAVLTRYGQLAPNGPASRTRRIWFWLDEFPDLKQIAPDAMAGLLTKGRSKGVAVVLGVQTLMQVVNEYGREVGKAILSQCQNIAILGLGDLDDETAEYAMRVVGQVERHEHRETDTPQGLLVRRSTSAQPARREVLLSSEFADLPETQPENGLSGFYRTRSIRGFWGTVVPGSFLARTLVRPSEGVAAVEERDHAEHELEPWGPADYERLGLAPPEGGPRPEGVETPARKTLRVHRGGKPRAAVGS